MQKLLYWASYALVLVALIKAGVDDYRSRLVNDVDWIPAALAIPIAVYMATMDPQLRPLYIIDAVFGCVLALVIYLGGFMGEADSIALAIIALSTPPYFTIPPLSLIDLPVVATLINTIVPVVAMAAYNVALNLMNRRRCGGGGILEIVVMRCVRVSDILKKPLAYTSPGSPLFKATSDAKDYVDGLPSDHWLWMQYNYPYVLILATSYIIYLAVGNIILGPLITMPSPAVPI